MKKLMMALAVAVTAAAVNAGTVSWSISSVSKGDTALTAGYTYVFFAESAEAAQTEIAAIKALEGKGVSAVLEGMAGAAWQDVKKATAAGNFGIGTSAALGGVNPLPSNSDLGLAGSTTYYAYAVIFDAATVADIEDSSSFMIATGTPTTSGATTYADSVLSNRVFNMGGQSTNSETWYTVGVPEPTTGLLLLLGMAGLALKRKVA